MISRDAISFGAVRAARLLAAVLPAILVLSGCGSGRAEQRTDAAPPQVRVATARPTEPVLALHLPARTEAGESARVHARATGVVAERRVDLGDRVSAGQILARISAPEVDEAVQEAAADLAQAQAGEELARTHLRRAEPLARGGALSQEQLSERRAAFEAARAARDAAQARLAALQERQGFQTVRAPFDGVIAARNLDRGDRVVGDQAGAATPLFELVSLDPLRVIVDVPQSAALQIRPGIEAEVHFAELHGETLRAEVVRLAHIISGESGGMRVELRLPNPGDRLPAGMIGEVRLQLPRADSAAVVPIGAVLQGEGGARVAILTGDATLDFRTVVLGRNLGNEIEIVDGIAAGDVVVLAPNALLQAGARVEVAEQGP